MKKTQLFLLHFAGGSCYSFQFLENFLNDFEIIPLELPGRGKRMNEDLLYDFNLAVNDIYDQILKKIGSADFIIYGHSMGAYLALQVAFMLIKQNKSPKCIFVSGNPGPGISSFKNRSLLEREELIYEIKKLGGVSEEFFDNSELFEFYEPILRADFEIAEKNTIAKHTLLDIPIYAMMGSKEEEANEIVNWSNFTTARFDSQILSGDHFFIYNHPQQIGHIIKSYYDKVAFQ